MIAPLASIVIPSWRDAAPLAGLLDALGSPQEVEILVVEAGAPDPLNQRLRDRRREVRWLHAPRGRASQMNRGATDARGRWLMFLHADCRLAGGWLDELRQADRAGAVGGSFRLQLDSPARAARTIERGVAWRVRWLGLPYGDQALFVRGDVFRRLGGYRPLPLMEDVDLVRRLRRVGPLHHSSLPVLASARGWERDGWVRRSATNLLLVVLFFLGVSPAWLARVYYRTGAGTAGAVRDPLRDPPCGIRTD